MADRVIGRLFRRWATVRARATLGGAAVVTVALIIGTVLFVGVLERNLTDAVLAGLRTRAGDLGGLLEGGALPVAIVNESTDEEFLQIIDDDGDVVASSALLHGRPPVIDLAPGHATRTAVPFDDDPFLAYASRASIGNSRITLLVGRSLEPVDEASAAVIGLLAVAVPAVVLLVAGVTWLVVGRALAPVERIRGEVAAISATELHRRVQEPAAEDEIARLARTMNAMLDRLDAAARRQREFVSDTSHELRSPIAAIREQAEVALAHPDGASVAQLAQSVLADDLRLQRLVEDLLLLARADEHSLRLGFRPVDVDDLVFEAARRLRSRGDLRIDTSSVSPARTLGDEAALRRVIDNLADNAARHARAVVAFSLRQTQAELTLSVDDDGGGIPVPDRQRVFERFVRLDEARARDGGGVGLGLAVVAEIVAAHGGQVAVQDGSLGGARFEVLIPTTPDPG